MSYVYYSVFVSAASTYIYVYIYTGPPIPSLRSSSVLPHRARRNAHSRKYNSRRAVCMHM